jgi:hypothetical protein
LYLDPSPRDIRVVRINDTAIHVYWSPIYHPPVERYLIHYIDKSENKPEMDWSLFTPTNPGATSAIISKLKADAMYNVRVSAEFAPTNLHEPPYSSGTTRREGDLSEIHVADIYRRKIFFFLFYKKKKKRKVCVTKTFLLFFMSCLFLFSQLIKV